MCVCILSTILWPVSGDVFAWGAGRRGQLGFKNSEKLPTKLEKPKRCKLKAAAVLLFHS